jgi:hypothetical protein
MRTLNLRATAVLQEHQIHSPVNRIGKEKSPATHPVKVEAAFLFSPMDELIAQSKKRGIDAQ